MRVVFVCNSSFQILVAAMLRRLHYPKDNIVLALDEYFYHTLVSCCNLSDNRIFDEVCCLRDANLRADVDSLLSITPDKVHLFNLGTECSCLVEEMCSCSVEMTDEGIGSYQLQKMWKDQSDKLMKLKAIWLLAPEMSQDYSLGIPIRPIRIAELFNRKKDRDGFLKEINHFFNYDPEEIPDIFYFDRYFISANMMPTSFERLYLFQLTCILANYKSCVKVHPLESIKLAQYRYRNLGIPLFRNTRTPWEVILLNHLSIKPIVLVSINSTPIILSKVLASALDMRVEAVCLIDWVKDYVDPPERFIETLVDYYNQINPTTPIFRIKSAEDLSSVLESFSFLHCVKEKCINITEKSSNSERDWLLKEYLWYSKTFGNMLDTVRIAFEDPDGCIVYSNYMFYSWRDEKINIVFSLPQIMTNATIIRIALSSSGRIHRTNNIHIKLTNNWQTQHWCSPRSDHTEITVPLSMYIEKVEVKFDIEFPLETFNFKEYHQ